MATIYYKEEHLYRIFVERCAVFNSCKRKNLAIIRGVSYILKRTVKIDNQYVCSKNTTNTAFQQFK